MPAEEAAFAVPVLCVAGHVKMVGCAAGLKAVVPPPSIAAAESRQAPRNPRGKSTAQPRVPCFALMAYPVLTEPTAVPVPRMISWLRYVPPARTKRRTQAGGKFPVCHLYGLYQPHRSQSLPPLQRTPERFSRGDQPAYDNPKQQTCTVVWGSSLWNCCSSECPSPHEGSLCEE